MQILRTFVGAGSAAIMAVLLGCQGGCAVVDFAASNAAAQFTKVEPKNWDVRLNNEQAPSGERISGFMLVEGGFAEDEPRRIDVSLGQLQLFSKPFKGEPGSTFVGRTPMRLSMVIRGQKREVFIPLQDLVKKPVQGEFWMDVGPENVTLRFRPLTGRKEWSPGTSNVDWSLGDFEPVFAGKWIEAR